MANVRPIPEGYHTVTPYLVCDGAAQAIEFYKKAFGATEIMRLPGPDGRIGHAEIRIGDSIIMLADESPQMGPLAEELRRIADQLYVENVDAMVPQAIAAGGKLTRPLKDEFYGDRAATIVDPSGHTWHLHTHIRDVTPEEIQKAVQAAGQSS